LYDAHQQFLLSGFLEKEVSKLVSEIRKQPQHDEHAEAV